MFTARALCLLAVCGAVSSATTYDVTQNSGEALHLWGMFPQDDITAKVGDTIHFKSIQMFHDVGLVPTAAALESCDVSGFTSWVDNMGVKADAAPGEVVVMNGMYDYTFTLTDAEIGTWYFVCSVASGGHCRAGQKLTLTVTAAENGATAMTHKVMASSAPFWTVGLSYPDMTIMLGDSLRFTSDTEGYHDVAILDDTACPNAECCAMGEMQPEEYTSLYSTDDFKDNAVYTWTPASAGTYHVVCTVSSGGHCQFGQQFKVMVEAVESDAEESAATSSAPAVFLAVLSAAAALMFAH